MAEFTEPEADELLAQGQKDEASNQKGAGVGLVLTSSEMVIIEKSLRLDFPATNNEAEY